MKTLSDRYMASRRKPTLGFTLVELMVTIVIVVVLASITFAVSVRMKEKANKTVCMNNLRQIGVMMNGYAAEHNRYYPAGGNPEGYIRRLCRDLYEEYPDTGGPRDSAFFQEGPGKVFCCPSDKSGKEELTKSYLANGRIVGTTDQNSDSGWLGPYRAKPIISVKQPSRTFLVIEHWVPKTKLWRGNDVKNSPEWKGENFHAHGTGRHYLYVDGHIEFHEEDPGLKGDARKIHYHGE